MRLFRGGFMKSVVFILCLMMVSSVFAANVEYGISNALTGDFSSVFGISNISSGMYGTALGYSNNSASYFSLACGSYNTASGDSCVAVGFSNQAIGNNSIAIGNSNTTNSMNSMALGHQFTIGTNLFDAMFSVGIGLDGMPRTLSQANTMAIMGGKVGIDTLAPTSVLHVVGLPVYANNAAAVMGGLTSGAFYRTGADPDPVCVVH